MDRTCQYETDSASQILISDEESEEYDYDDCESFGDEGGIVNSVNDVEEALVYLRIRPVEFDETTSNYKIANNILIASPAQTDNAQNVIEKQFTFTDIFNSSVGQLEIYENCVRRKVEVQENLTVMSYGTSGSGKTFTLLGDMDNPGIIPRAIANIFQTYSENLSINPIFKIKNGEIAFVDDETTKETYDIRTALLGNADDVESSYDSLQTDIIHEHEFGSSMESNASVYIWVSFAEIYNEIVLDLLKPEEHTNQKNRLHYNNSSNKSGLRVISNDGRVFVKNLTSVYVRNGLEAYKLLTVGLNRITYASTAINENSSRSHCIFFVDIIKYNKPDVSKVTYKFCDLAGSERLGKTNHIGSRLQEAKRINTSLMVLGRCLDAAYNNQTKKHHDVVPFRESKLTMLLQGSLLGKETMALIVNITPADSYYEENLNVLGFASIAKSIAYKIAKQKPQKTRFSWLADNTLENSQESFLTQQFNKLADDNMCLRNENKRLTGIIAQQQIDFDNELALQEIATRKELVDMFEKDIKRRNERWENEITRILRADEAKYKSMKEYYESKLEELNEEEEISDSSANDSIEQIRKSLNGTAEAN